MCPIIQNGLNLSHTCGPFQSNLGLINVSGGTPPYQYSLDGVNFQSNYLFNPLPAGLYTVTVKDAAGAILKYSVALHDPCNYAISLNGIVIPAQCGQNGSITVTATDGVSPYQYSIDGVNFQASNQFTGLAPGNYTIVVEDADGVASSRLFIVGNGCLSLATTTTNSTCGNNNGSITVQANNGTAPCQYSIDGSTFTSSNQFNNLAAGTYNITVKDATGGTNVITATVANIAGPAIASIVATPADCSNSTGTITLTIQGGTAPLQYSINGTNFQSAALFTGLANGSYTAITKDANGCTHSAAVIVPLNNTLTVNAGNNVTICEGETIMLSASSNGNNFQWSPSTSLTNGNILTPNASPTTTTGYTLTATLGICSETESVTVFVNPAPVANAGADTTICTGNNVQLRGSGGTVYSWSPSTWLSSSTIPGPIVTGPATGVYNYSLTVKDNNGCSSLSPSMVRVTVFSPVVNAGRDTIILMNQPFQLQATDPGNYGFSNYNWSPPTGLNNSSIKDPVAVLNNDIRYTLTAKTANGCIATDDIQIKVIKEANIYVPTGFTPDNNGLNDILKAIPVGIKEFKYFRVYNRWGQLIFQTESASRGWDGKVNGMLQQSGVFVWMTEGISFTGTMIKRKGTVMLIR